MRRAHAAALPIVRPDLVESYLHRAAQGMNTDHKGRWGARALLAAVPDLADFCRLPLDRQLDFNHETHRFISWLTVTGRMQPGADYLVARRPRLGIAAGQFRSSGVREGLLTVGAPRHAPWPSVSCTGDNRLQIEPSGGPSAFRDLSTFVACPRVNSLALSVDGTRLVAAVQSLSGDGTRFVSGLWEIDPAGERDALRLTRSDKGESRPVFGPDGTLYFLSERAAEDGDEGAALWALPPRGEAVIVARHPGGIAAVTVARDSGALCHTAGLLPGAADAEAHGKLRAARKDAKVTAILYEAGRPLHGTGPDTSQSPGPLQDVGKLQNLHQLGPLEANMPGPLTNVTAIGFHNRQLICGASIFRHHRTAHPGVGEPAHELTGIRASTHSASQSHRRIRTVQHADDATALLNRAASHRPNPQSPAT